MTNGHDGVDKKFLFEYRHDGAVWALEVEAPSPDAARERVKSMAWAQYKGEIKARVNVPCGGLVAKVLRLFFGSSAAVNP